MAIAWETILPSIVAVLGVVGTVYGVISSARAKQQELQLQTVKNQSEDKIKQIELKISEQKQTFEQDKTRRDAIVEDIGRCENRIDELETKLYKWMTDYDSLHAKHLQECQDHGETRLTLANCERRMANLESQIESLTKDRDQAHAKIELLQAMLIQREETAMKNNGKP